MATTPRKMFLNLPVKDLDRSVAFFTALGFEFNPQFTDETATCMLVGEDAYVMLLTEPKFADFTVKPLADANAATGAIVALTAESREAADAFADTALANGGSPGQGARWTWASCTGAASPTPTATTGRSSGWTPPPWRGRRYPRARWSSTTSQTAVMGGIPSPPGRRSGVEPISTGPSAGSSGSRPCEPRTSDGSVGITSIR